MPKRKNRSLRDKVRRNAQESARRGLRYIKTPEGTAFLKVPTDERITFNILPYKVSLEHHPDGVAVGDLWYKRPFKLHRGVGVENSLVVCPISIGKRCPICEYQRKLYEEGQTEWSTLKKLRPAERVLYVVEVLSGQKEKGLHLFEVSNYAFQKRLDGEINDPENEEYAGFADPEGGYAVRVRFREENFEGHPYACAERIDFVKRSKDPKPELVEHVLSHLRLDECLNILSYEEIKKMFMEIGDDAVEEEEGEEYTRPRQLEDEVDEEETDTPSEERSGDKCPEGFRWGDAAKESTSHDECDDCPHAIYKKCASTR